MWELGLQELGFVGAGFGGAGLVGAGLAGAGFAGVGFAGAGFVETGFAGAAAGSCSLLTWVPHFLLLLFLRKHSGALWGLQQEQ